MDVKAQHQNGSINVNNNSSSASLSSADSNSSSNIASSVGSNSSSSSSTLSNNTGNGQTETGNNSGSSKQQQQQQQVNKCNLIINYLPQSVKEADFNQLFAKIGPLKSCRLMFDRQTGYSFGYGFVEYTNEEDAKKAIDTLNGYQIEHKRLKVSLARPNCDETKNTNLYVRNIPMSYDEQQLQDLFGQCGEVIQARILRDQNTSFSRRIGFVIMATKQMAQQAIQKLDNTMPPEVGGGSGGGGTAPEPIYVKYADEDGKNKRGGMSGGHHHHHHHHHNQGGVGHHHHNHHHNNHHQNQYQHRGNNPNSFNQFQNSFQNASFMMNNQQQQQHQQQNSMSLANLSNSLANLGKMKNQRSNAHQNHRYNPILNANGGAANPTNLIGMGNGGSGAGGGGSGAAGPGGINNVSTNSANFSNPWNLNMSNLNQGQPPFSAFNTSGVASGFDSLINNTLAGMNTNYMHHAAAAAAHHQNTNFLESSLGVVIDGNKSLYNSGTGSNNNNNASSGAPTTTIYVYGIGQQASEADLYSLFANYGRISRVNVIKNSKTGLCKGFGFVVFESPEEANYAVHSMNGFMYNNRPLQVQLHNE